MNRRASLRAKISNVLLHPAPADDGDGDDAGLSDSGSDSEFEPPSEESVSDSSDFSESEEEHLSTVTSSVHYVAKDETVWSSMPPPKSQTQARNILTGPLQKSINCGHVAQEIDAFNLYLSQQVIDEIVQHTNSEGQRLFQERKGDWNDTDAMEIRALIGMLLTLGIMKQNMLDTDVLWSKTYGIPIIKATMSRTRFQDLLTALRFDDKTTRSQRKEKDKLAAIRNVWEIFHQSLIRYYSPGSNLTVDEQLIPYRGRCSFIQYMPMKPDKYGLKCFWIVDSASFYPLKCIPYLGKEGKNRKVNLGREITLDLCRPFFQTNRNVTTDNFFTDLALATELLSNGMTIVGTVRQNKRFLPPEFVKKIGRPVCSSLFGFNAKASIVSYQCKRNRCVCLLSTMHSTKDVGTTEQKKPEMILYYNSTKGGVDSLDQMVHQYTTKRKTKRWPLVMFYNMLDVAGVASYVLWKTKYPQWKSSSNEKRRLFVVAVAEDLMRPQLERRSSTSRALHADIRADIKAVTATVSSSNRVSDEMPPVKRRRCCICPSNKDRKSQQMCSKCYRNVCKDHSTNNVICTDCQD